MRVNDPNRRLIPLIHKREIVAVLWAKPEVKLQTRLISNAIRGKSGPYAFFENRINQAFADISVEQVLDDKYVNPTGDLYIRKRNAYFQNIHAELDQMIEAELAKRNLDWTGADIAEFHILLTNREIESNMISKVAEE